MDTSPQVEEGGENAWVGAGDCGQTAIGIM